MTERSDLLAEIKAANYVAPVELSPEQKAAIGASKAAAARGEFATDAEVRAMWAKHGL